MKRIKQYLLRIKNKKNCTFGKRVVISKSSIFNGKNFIGNYSIFKHSKLGFQSYIGDCCEISNTIVGNFTCISHRVVVVQGQHPTNFFVSLHPSFFSKDYKHSYTSQTLFDNYKYLDEKIAHTGAITDEQKIEEDTKNIIHIQNLLLM